MKTLLQSLRLLAFFTILTGLLYPLLTTGLAAVIANDKANGSLIQINGQVIGSRLIGQKFATARYFHSRPSAVDYNPLPSGGTNLGPTSKKLLESVSAAKTEWGSSAPADLIYSSGSGLDPHISPEAARYQIKAVAKARGFDETKSSQLEQLVAQAVRERDLGFLGQETVNVLELNLALDKM